MKLLHRARIMAWLMWDASGFFEWLASRPWYTEILHDWVDTLPAQPDATALEVGCGPGTLSAQLHQRGVKVTGLDRSAAMVERARRGAPECTFVIGDALALPFEDGVMDLAYGASVVNVVSDPQALLHELRRVVRSGGQVSLLFPTPALEQQVDSIATHLDLKGLSAAALNTWGTRAPKREVETITALFQGAGLLDLRVDLFFRDTVASVTGSVP